MAESPPSSPSAYSTLRKGSSPSKAGRRGSDKTKHLRGSWHVHTRSSFLELSWTDFPQFLLSPPATKEVNTFALSLQLNIKGDPQDIDIVVIQCNPELQYPLLQILESDFVHRAHYTRTNDLELNVELDARAAYVIVPCIKTQQHGTKYVLNMKSGTCGIRDLVVRKLSRLHIKEAQVVWNNLPKKVASSEQQLSQWRIHCDVKSTIHVFLLQKEVEFKSNIGLSLYKFLKTNAAGVRPISEAIEVTPSGFKSKTEASVVIDIEPMYEYIVVPYTEAKSISGAATLRTFCQHDFSLSRPNQLHILDSWTDITSGGSPQLTSSWRKNSQFLLKLAGVATIKVSLTLLEHGALQSTDSQFGFLLLETKDEEERVSLTPEEMVSLSASACKLVKVDAVAVQHFELGSLDSESQYIIIPYIGHEGETGKFQLEVTQVNSSTAASIRLSPAIRCWRSVGIKGEWTEDSSGGSKHHPTWFTNPQYLITAEASGDHLITLGSDSEGTSNLFIGMHLVKESNGGKRIFSLENEIGRAEFKCTREVYRVISLTKGESFYVIPATLNPRTRGNFHLSVTTRPPVSTPTVRCVDDSYILVSGREIWPCSVLRGSLKHPSWRQNPCFTLMVKGIDKSVNVTIVLAQVVPTGESNIRVGGYVYERTDAARKKLLLSKTDCTAIPFSSDPASICTTSISPDAMHGYNIIAATEDQLIFYDVSFNLSVFIETGTALKSRTSALLTRTIEKSPWHTKMIKSQWIASNSGGGHHNRETFKRNSASLIRTNEPNTTVIAILLKPYEVTAGLYILERYREPGSQAYDMKAEWWRAKIVKGCCSKFTSNNKEASLKLTLPEAGEYWVIPCTYHAQSIGNYVVVLNADKPFELLDNSTSRQGSGRDSVLTELISTEIVYVDGLKAIVEKFRRPLINAIPTSDFNMIFSNIESIYQLHTDMLKELQALDNSPEKLARICQIFIEFSQGFKLYSDYHGSFFTGAPLLAKYKEKEPLKSMESQFTGSDPRQRGLADLLAAPIQRIGKYELLLGQLARYIGQYHADYAVLFKAKTCIHDALDHLNEILRRQDGLKKVVELESIIVTPAGDMFPLVSIARHHLKDGQVTMLQGPSPPGARHLFLFNDLLLVCSAGSKLHRIEFSFDCGVLFSFTNKKLKRYGTCFECNGMIFEASNEAILKEWEDAFQNAEILTAPIEFDPPESDSPPNRVPPKIPISISAPRATPVVPIPAQLIRTYSTPALRPRRPVDAWAFSAETDPAPPTLFDIDSSEDGSEDSLLTSSDSSPSPASSLNTTAKRTRCRLVEDYEAPDMGHVSAKKDEWVDVISVSSDQEFYMVLRDDDEHGWIPASICKIEAC